MFVIYGTKGFQRDGGLIADTTPCPMCGNTEYHRVFRVRQWFTLYWVPLVPYSTKYFKHCPRCGWDEENKALKPEFITGYRENKKNNLPDMPANAQLPQYAQANAQQGQYIPAQSQVVQQQAYAQAPQGQQPVYQQNPQYAAPAQVQPGAAPAQVQPGAAPSATVPVDPNSAYAKALGQNANLMK